LPGLQAVSALASGLFGRGWADARRRFLRRAELLRRQASLYWGVIAMGRGLGTANAGCLLDLMCEAVFLALPSLKNRET